MDAHQLAGSLLPPHVLIFPFPVQGHLNCMLKLAELLCIAGIHVTFLVTVHTHRRLHQYSAATLSYFSRYPGFRFETITDGLPEEHPRSGHSLIDLYQSLKSVTKPIFKELLLSTRPGSEDRRPVTCIIGDGIMSFTIDVAEETGIPIIYFRTISASAFWAYYCIPQLIEAGEVPFGENDMDQLTSNVPGMEGILRRRDLPSFCRADDAADRGIQLLTKETQDTSRAQALILNTFEELEGPALSGIRTCFPKVYSVGPLHLHIKSRLPQSPATSSHSLWEEDQSCMKWLDEQPLKSVIYVSFGSIATIQKEQLMEFWHGLVSSGKRFLWVIRKGSIVGEEGRHQIPAEISEGTNERGYMVEWAPQEKVLSHPSVGGFWTHSGWNSTLESIVAGVPMMCWPYFADQQVISRFVGHVWRLGIDMKDTCDRGIVERTIKDLMEVRSREFAMSTVQMGNLARQAVSQGGSSSCNLDSLIDDIRLMCLGA